ncbi:unnamed protein product, partial [Laminaria digitata]
SAPRPSPALAKLLAAPAIRGPTTLPTSPGKQRAPPRGPSGTPDNPVGRRLSVQGWEGRHLRAVEGGGFRPCEGGAISGHSPDSACDVRDLESGARTGLGN